MAYLKVTQKEIKQRVKSGELVDISYRQKKDLPKGRIIAASHGSIGINGAIIKGDNGRFYAIVGRSGNIFYYN